MGEVTTNRGERFERLFSSSLCILRTIYVTDDTRVNICFILAVLTKMYLHDPICVIIVFVKL